MYNIIYLTITLCSYSRHIARTVLETSIIRLFVLEAACGPVLSGERAPGRVRKLRSGPARSGQRKWVQRAVSLPLLVGRRGGGGEDAERFPRDVQVRARQEDGLVHVRAGGAGDRGVLAGDAALHMPDAGWGHLLTSQP